MVGYSESSYTLSEAEGYVEVCVNAMSPGTAAEFDISSTATESMYYASHSIIFDPKGVIETKQGRGYI